MFTKQKELNEPKSFRLGFGGKLLVGTIVPIISMLFILAVVIIGVVYNAIYNEKSNNIENQTIAASAKVQDYFNRFTIIADMVQSQKIIRDLILEAENSSPDFRLENSSSYPIIMNIL